MSESVLMPAGSLRRALRGHGHGLGALVQVGKAGVTQPLEKQVLEALHAHELVKVKVGTEAPTDRFAVAALLAALPGVQVVQIVGRTVLLYKRHPRTPRFEGRRAAERRAQSPAPRRGRP